MKFLIAEDLPDQISDEIDFVNILFRQKCGMELLKPNFTPSNADLFGKWESEEEFTHRVAAVANLIDRMKLSEELLASEEKQLL